MYIHTNHNKCRVFKEWKQVALSTSDNNEHNKHSPKSGPAMSSWINSAGIMGSYTTGFISGFFTQLDQSLVCLNVYVSIHGFSGRESCSRCTELVKNLGNRQDTVRSRWPLNPGIVSLWWCRCRGRWRALLCSRPKWRKTPSGSCYIKRSTER